MIWHVPNDVEVNQWSDQAFLKYYTNTGFLANYSETLYSMYSTYFPMEVTRLHTGTNDLTSTLFN